MRETEHDLKPLREVNLFALPDIPLIKQGDNLGEMICRFAAKSNFTFETRDVVVIASKIVSKAEGRLVDTETIRPSEKTASLAEKLGMDPKNLEVILGETKRLLIARPGLLLTEHHLGFICTKASVDSSNTTAGPKGKVVALLPENPDASAKKIREVIQKTTRKKVAVIVNDTFGRPDRLGSVGMAIGISGIAAVYTPSITMDIFGKQRHPEIAQVDEIAAAASLLMGQTNERRPVIIVRGVEYQASETSGIKDLLHPTEKYIQDAQEIVRNPF